MFSTPVQYFLRTFVAHVHFILFRVILSFSLLHAHLLRFFFLDIGHCSFYIIFYFLYFSRFFFSWCLVCLAIICFCPSVGQADYLLLTIFISMLRWITYKSSIFRSLIRSLARHHATRSSLGVAIWLGVGVGPASPQTPDCHGSRRNKAAETAQNTQTSSSGYAWYAAQLVERTRSFHGRSRTGRLR